MAHKQAPKIKSVRKQANAKNKNKIKQNKQSSEQTNKQANAPNEKPFALH